MGTNTKRFCDENGICGFCQAEVAAGCSVCLQCRAVRWQREVADDSMAKGAGLAFVTLGILCLGAPFVGFATAVLLGNLLMAVGIHPGAAVLVGFGVFIWCAVRWMSFANRVQTRTEYIWDRAGYIVIERVERG